MTVGTKTISEDLFQPEIRIRDVNDGNSSSDRGMIRDE